MKPRDSTTDQDSDLKKKKIISHYSQCGQMTFKKPGLGCERRTG